MVMGATGGQRGTILRNTMNMHHNNSSSGGGAVEFNRQTVAPQSLNQSMSSMIQGNM